MFKTNGSDIKGQREITYCTPHTNIYILKIDPFIYIHVYKLGNTMKDSSELSEILYTNDSYWYKQIITFSEKKNYFKCLKLVFDVGSTHCNKCYYTTWHVVKQILNVCLRKTTPCSLYAYLKFICRSC